MEESLDMKQRWRDAETDEEEERSNNNNNGPRVHHDLDLQTMWIARSPGKQSASTIIKRTYRRADMDSNEGAPVSDIGSSKTIMASQPVFQTVWIAKSPGKPSKVIKTRHHYTESELNLKTNGKEEPQIFIKKRLRCDICGKNFVFKNVYELHVDLCRNGKKFEKIANMKDLQCLLCDRKFSKVQHLRSHASRHLGLFRFKCKICGFASYYQSEVKHHIPLHRIPLSSSKFYVLPFEERSTDAEPSVSSDEVMTLSVVKQEESADSVNDEDPDDSEEVASDFDFESVNKIFSHDLNKKREHFPQLFNMCELCGRKYTFKTDLERHVSFCSKNKKFLNIVDIGNLKCVLCDKNFSNLSNLRKHASKHLKMVRFKCKICDFMGYYKSQIKRHLTFHKLSIRPSKYDSYISTIYHMEKNTQSSAIAEKAVISLSVTPDTVLHEKSPSLKSLAGKSQENLFVSNACNINMSDKGALVEKDIHSTTELMQCEACRRNFSLKSNFKRHVNLCKSNKKFKEIADMDRLQCLFCDKRFSAVQHLKSHVSRHIGLFRFKCKICTFASFYQSEIKQHIPAHKTIDALNWKSYLVELDPYAACTEK